MRIITVGVEPGAVGRIWTAKHVAEGAISYRIFAGRDAPAEVSAQK